MRKPHNKLWYRRLPRSMEGIRAMKGREYHPSLEAFVPEGNTDPDSIVWESFFNIVSGQPWCEVDFATCDDAEWFTTWALMKRYFRQNDRRHLARMCDIIMSRRDLPPGRPHAL